MEAGPAARDPAAPPDPGPFDAYTPREIAARVRAFGVAKAGQPLLSLVMLGLLAGVYIGLGALMFTLVNADGSLGFAVSRLLGGLAFSLGMLIVTIAGAELFTGNNLLAMAWADGQLRAGEVLRHWGVACAANFAGACALAWLVALSGHSQMNGGAVARAAVRIAEAKAGLPIGEAFARAILCNLLVCMAVWMGQAGRSVTDKAVAVLFPITAFVAAGFEHSIANVYFFALAVLLGSPLDGAAVAANLAVVVAGNLVGGSVLVALVYRVIYRLPDRAAGPTGGPRATRRDGS